MATPSVIDIRPAAAAGGRRLAAAEELEEPAATAAFPEVTDIMMVTVSPALIQLVGVR